MFKFELKPSLAMSERLSACFIFKHRRLMAGITDPSEPDLIQNLTGFDSATEAFTSSQLWPLSVPSRSDSLSMLLAIGLPQRRWTVTDRQTLRPSFGDGLIPAGER